MSGECFEILELTMTQRQFFITIVVFVTGMFTTYEYGRLIGRAEERGNTRIALKAMAQQAPLSAEIAKTGPPEELDAHRLTGQFEGFIGGLSFNFTRYSRLDESHDNREWSSLACVDAGQGMEISGRWNPSQWWVSAHDFDHPFPDSIRIPVKDIPDSPLHESVRPIGIR